jgi:signal transduction histidine kinase
MESQLTRSEQKLSMLMKHAPMGMAEIDRSGNIIYINTRGEGLLKPVISADNLSGHNFYMVLERIAPAIAEKIKQSSDTGSIVADEIHSFSFTLDGEKVERHFSFMVTKTLPDCIIVAFDDVTENFLKREVIQQLVSEKAIAQGKFEIAANVLHDIGNAVVGIGSYLNRMSRSLEQSNFENLANLSGYFTAQQQGLASAIGEAKAGAVVTMLSSITEAQKNAFEEMRKSLHEQGSIITHIQDILNIQRQYLTGHETQEKEAIHLRSVINDCMSMLFASIEKRGITVSLNVPAGLPVLQGSRTRLMQVILNLIKNSIEAIDINAAEKSIVISANLYEGMLVMEIRDSGHGFDKQTGKQLFERGFTTKSSGTGLGLSNCRMIVESHNGKIDIFSEGRGKGAIAIIKFNI